MIACMGGFACKSRERCANYYAESTIPPAERLCGTDEQPEPLRDMRSTAGDLSKKINVE